MDAVHESISIPPALQANNGLDKLVGLGPQRCHCVLAVGIEKVMTTWGIKTWDHFDLCDSIHNLPWMEGTRPRDLTFSSVQA